MAITIYELAGHRLHQPDATKLTGADFEEAGLPILGGCEVCAATVAAYNACPSQSGYLRCTGCIGTDGWDTVEDADRALFGEGVPA